MRKLYKINGKCAALLALCLVMALTMGLTACGQKAEEETDGGESIELPVADGTVLGEGEKSFTFVIADKEGAETTLEIHTDAESVGDALSQLGLIDGEEGQYGLYVKSVNGIEADYDKDGVYWAFYIDGEYALTSVDATEVTDGAVYAFRVEK